MMQRNDKETSYCTMNKKKCFECGKTYTARRRDQKYCSGACRSAAHRAKRGAAGSAKRAILEANRMLQTTREAMSGTDKITVSQAETALITSMEIMIRMVGNREDAKARLDDIMVVSYEEAMYNTFGADDDS